MIYLDNAATTQPSERAVARAAEYLKDKFYNPSARYHGGELVAKELKESRDALVGFVADRTEYDLVFTSCGTEADNQAVFSAGKRGNVVISAGEHAAVYNSAVALKNRGIELRIALLRRDGSVDSEEFLRLIDEKTSLASLVHVNNETGAVNDVAAVAEAVKRKNPRCVFHSDGVQAFGKIPFRLNSAIDLYSVSAHKIGALKGTGALLRRKTCNLSPLVYGGGQEGALRSGTENTFGIACFRYAAEEKFACLEKNAVRLSGLRERLWALLDPALFERISPNHGSPYILTVSAACLRGEVLQRMLWDRGVAVGTGSACSSKKPHSRVIEACGYSAKTLDGVLRVSFAAETTEEEVACCAREMNFVARKLKEKLK